MVSVLSRVSPPAMHFKCYLQKFTLAESTRRRRKRLGWSTTEHRGAVTSFGRCTFITSNYTDLSFSNHLDDYVATCLKNEIEYKIPAGLKTPVGWKDPRDETAEKGSTSNVQSTLDGIAKVVKRAPPVTKHGILEHILALISVCDLVSHCRSQVVDSI